MTFGASYQYICYVLDWFDCSGPMKYETAVIPAEAGIQCGAWILLLDPGLRRGDDFMHLRAGSIRQSLLGWESLATSTVDFGSHRSSHRQALACRITQAEAFVCTTAHINATEFFGGHECVSAQTTWRTEIRIQGRGRSMLDCARQILAQRDHAASIPPAHPVSH